MDKYQRHWALMRDGPAHEALLLVRRLAREATTDAELAALAVTLMEPLVDMHWHEIYADLEDALERSSSLRRVLRGSILHIPQEIEDELRARAID